MTNNPKLKIVLFALTGFGNAVLKALLDDSRVDVRAVFTIRYEQPFPYYDERHLLEESASRGIVCHHGVQVNSDEGVALLQECSPDLIIVATFKQIIKEKVLSLPKLGVVNFHPSLLPRYRGPCPTNAALLNDDETAGVTVHYVTEQVDEGNILLQKIIPVGAADQDGDLRKKLAELSGAMVPDVISMFAGFTRPEGVPQNNALATHAPKPSVEDGYLEHETDIRKIRNKVRALNPVPGTSLLLGGRRIPVSGCEMIQAVGPDGVYDRGDEVDVVLGSQTIRLFKKI